MKNAEILSVGPMYSASLEAMERDFAVHRLWQSKDKPALLHQVRDRIRGIQSFGPYGVDAKLIDALPRLEIVANVGAGLDAIDLDAAKRRGVIVTNTPDVLNDCVADLAMGLTIATLRRMITADRYVRAGSWPREPMLLARKVSGKSMGILGLGRIGKAIARRAKAFDMRIAYHGRKAQAGVSYKYYAKLVDMARDCDILMVICAGGAETYHLVNAEVLAALGPEGTLINVARGSVVDEPALVKALAEGTLGAAGLDVFEVEPRVPEALWAMDNVVLQPHMASATHETRKAMGDLAVDNLRAHFDGKPVLTQVV